MVKVAVTAYHCGTRTLPFWVSRGGNKSQHSEGFAKSHIVGENPTQEVLGRFILRHPTNGVLVSEVLLVSSDAESKGKLTCEYKQVT